MQKKNITAIHEHDLNDFLSNLGLFDQFVGGQLNCFYCGDVLSVHNLGTIFVKNNEIAISCSKINCLSQMN